MPLPAFKDEAEFREKWIAPLLQKLGYILVTHTHGDSEQGKDFIFADFDKFEHIRYYAIQAKNGNIGAGSVELDKLLNQVRRSFTVRIRNQKGGSEQRVSGVYVFASGKISDEAREYITDFCRSEHFGENVYFLDGDRLERIEQFATYRDDQEKRMRLASLAVETGLNLKLISDIRMAFIKPERGAFPTRCRTIAMNQALAFFPSQDSTLLAIIAVTLQFTEELNQMCEIWNQSIMTGSTISEQGLEMLTNRVDTALQYNTDLNDKIIVIANELNDRYKINIEILPEQDNDK